MNTEAPAARPIDSYVAGFTFVSLAAAVVGLAAADGRLVMLAAAVLTASTTAAPAAVRRSAGRAAAIAWRAAKVGTPVFAVLLASSLLVLGAFVERRSPVFGGLVLLALLAYLWSGSSAETGLAKAASGVRGLVLLCNLSLVSPGRRYVNWGHRRLRAKYADERFYRIQGLPGTAKTHLTRLFAMEVVEELRRNPHAKLVWFEPVREAYQWLQSLGLDVPIHYFMPSDNRGEAQDLAKDFPTEQDANTYAHAFWPVDPNEKQRFWGDCMRTIFVAVYMAVLKELGYVTLRLVLCVLQSPDDTRRLLRRDIYNAMAARLAATNGGEASQVERDIRLTLDSRVTEMRTIAAQLDHAARERDPFSLGEFLEARGPRILVVSKDSTFHLTQDPMNAMLFMRMVQLLDSQQRHPRRKIFIIIDEFVTLAGDKPCPNIVDAFLRLRSRGAVLLITYQAAESLTRVYGPQTASEILKVCQNVIENLEPATEWRGVRGKARAAVGRWWWPLLGKTSAWQFRYGSRLVSRRIPKADPRIADYSRRDSSHQRMPPLSMAERKRLGLIDVARRPVGTEEEAADFIAAVLERPERASLILQDEAYFRRAYRDAAKLLHPDKVEGHEELMKRLNAARDILRKYYERTRGR